MIQSDFAESTNVLVFNCGSSSLKYRLIELPSEKELAAGEAQRVGPKTSEPSRILHFVNGREETHLFEMPDHDSAFERVMSLLLRDESLTPDVIGHRLVHGGEYFKSPTVISARRLYDLEALRDLAPLHNPPAINLVNACIKRYPDLPQVLVCDTAFHSTIPTYASTYALPTDIRENLNVRKYGFHGISHQFVSVEAARWMGISIEECNAVSCHLGSGGASLCAIKEGRSVDNTMGYSPLQGLIMSTRCGDLDPSVTLRLLDHSDGDFQMVETILNKRSGVLGMSGFSADIRDVLGCDSPRESARLSSRLAAQIYLWRIRKYLGAYLTVVGEPAAIIFTDTIGELVPEVRWSVCSGLEAFGVKLDPQKNWNVEEYPVDVSAADSCVRILVVKTNEELAIARYTRETVKRWANNSGR